MDIKVDNKLIVSALLLFLLLIVGIKQYDVKDKFKKEETNTIEKVNEKMKIKLIINDKEYIATLEDNDTSKELLERLPLEIEMTELNGNEKYYTFNNKFISNPTNIKTINKGDIMLFNDDCLVLFYKSFDTTYKYTKIGSLVNPNELELNDENITVKIEK
jgi:hypothetical protein